MGWRTIITLPAFLCSLAVTLQLYILVSMPLSPVLSDLHCIANGGQGTSVLVGLG